MSPGDGYAETPPPAWSASLVTCTWRRTVSAAAPAVVRVLPDGCVDVVRMADGRLIVAGPDTGPVLHDLEPGVDVAGVRFAPGAAGAVLGLPAAELRDLRVELGALGDPLGPRLEQAVGVADPAAVPGLLLAAVARRAARGPSPDPLVAAAITRLRRPGCRVGALAADLGISDRQLRRRFHDAVGYGPKVLDRVLRLRRFLDLSPAAGELAGAAAAAGYADQAHLARDCGRLAGIAPRRLLAERAA